MRVLLFGIALSAATLTASSSFAAWAVCAPGYKADPKIINGSEDHGQTYLCAGRKEPAKLVCSSGFTPGKAYPPTDNGSALPDDMLGYVCAEPASK